MTSEDAQRTEMNESAEGSEMSQAGKIAAWTPIAYQGLIETARRYNSVITYKELGELVQVRSGIRTRQRLDYWIGKLLEEVARLARANREPPLTSLCVHQDGTIGPGYANAPKHVADTPGEDIEYYAAQHRLLCYQKYSEDLPDDGGSPALTRAVAARRARKAAQEPPVPTVCPNCFIAVPATGVCDSCGWRA